jgi:hypothetical protein
VDEALDHSGQKKVEGAQSEDGEGVRCEDEERVGGDGEDGRNGVDGEEHVGGLDHDEHRQQRGGQPPAGPAHEESLALVVGGHRYDPAHEAEKRIAVRMNLGVAVAGHLHAGDDEERAEQVSA